MGNEKTPKNAENYVCKKCKFKCSKKSDHIRHLGTAKHKMITNGNAKAPKSAKIFDCECGKKYKHSSGLSRHKSKCNIQCQPPIVEEIKKFENDTIIQMLLESNNNNNKLTEKIMEMENQQIINNTINNNQKVNINVFLNEDCKYAMNLTEFINQIQPSIDDLMYTKTNGYIKGITNIFTKNLDDISSIERPIHYIQDKKENHIFVKEDNVWGQDSEVDKLGQSIDSVARKQINQIKQWESKNPDWNTTEQGINEYMQIIQNVMGGSTECEREKNRNLIKKGLSENIDISTDVKNED